MLRLASASLIVGGYSARFACQRVACQRSRAQSDSIRG